VTISGIPENGRPVYLRIWYKIGSVWGKKDFTYQGPPVRVINVTVTPAAGARLTPTQRFTWSEVPGATEFFVMLGVRLGGGTIYSQSVGNAREVTISGIPENGRPVYLRLWYKIGNGWGKKDLTYQGPTVRHIGTEITSITPPVGTVISSVSQIFTWNTVPTATSYYVELGRTVGGRDIYAASVGTARSVTISNLPGPEDGHTLYLRIWYKKGTVWFSQDFTFMVRDCRTICP
jgi:hypothetical protein